MNKIFLSFILLASVCTLTAQKETEPITFDAGSFTITTLNENEVQRPSKPNNLIGATEEILNQYIPGGTYNSATNAFLLESSGKNILVDAGVGNRLTDNLAKCGKNPGDIHIILLTHMHGDHIGGLLKDGKKVFPNATLYMSHAEHDYWTNNEIMQSLPENKRRGFTHAQEVVKIYRDKLQLFVPDEADKMKQELLPGIRSIAAYGHTPGHTAYLLDSDGYQLLIWGDLTHVTPIQIPRPEIAVTYDTNPEQAIKTRQQLLKYVSENRIRIAGMHVEYPGLGNVKGDPSEGYDFKLLCDCEGSLPDAR